MRPCGRGWPSLASMWLAARRSNWPWSCARNSPAIEFAACTALGIPVTTGKSNSPDAPAELALALIVASRRNVALEAERMKRGEWPCTLSHRLRGSTLGIFGLGAIGQLVAEGGRGLGMDIVVWGQENSLKQAAAKGYTSAASKSELFEHSDVLSLHVRLTRETRGIVTVDDLARMKPTALIVNTARAEIIAPEALREAFEQIVAYERGLPLRLRNPDVGMRTSP